MGTELGVTGENLQKWFLLNFSLKKNKKIAYYWNCGTFIQLHWTVLLYIFQSQKKHSEWQEKQMGMFL